MNDLFDDAMNILNNNSYIYLHLRRKLLSPGSEEVAIGTTVVTESEQVPNPDSRITLSERKDLLGIPLSKIDWQLTDLDKHNAVVNIRTAAVELARLFNIRMRLPGWMTDGDGGWQNSFVDIAHHMGTTRMSSSSDQGVVDKNCKVHGIGNLFVSGSSVFATSSYINPTFTIVALAIANYIFKDSE
jgi:choline dehydrogenase-like flavoprotein